MEGSIFFGNTCHNGLVPPVARSALPSVHSALAIKHFLPFPLDSNASAAVNLFPGFNAMDPVQKAVLQHTLGFPPAAATAKRRHVSCGVCRLRFNSQNQALAHYKGTKHARKLKARDAPKSKLKRTPLAKEPKADRKDVVPSPAPPPLSPALRLAPPSESTTTLETPTDVAGTLTSVTDAPETTSEVELNSASEPEPDLDPDKEPEKDAEPETEEEKARRLLYCSLCKVAVNSASQLEAHSSGTKHKTMMEARSGVGCIKSFPRPGVKGKVAPPSSSKASTGLQNKTFYCETCDVHVNSETQLKQHISSRRHKDRAAGKPAKPKYTPYSKGATKQTQIQQIKLNLGKDRPCPPLAAHLLPAQLMAAAAAAIGNTFPQRSTHGHAPNAALFPTPPLPAPLLRPAPGPIRTAHPQVLFAPY
ncbi:zinc finger protein 385D isoform X4 [Vanacampus margaritifer]